MCVCVSTRAMLSSSKGVRLYVLCWHLIFISVELFPFGAASNPSNYYYNNQSRETHNINTNTNKNTYIYGKLQNNWSRWARAILRTNEIFHCQNKRNISKCHLLIIEKKSINIKYLWNQFFFFSLQMKQHGDQLYVKQLISWKYCDKIRTSNDNICI